jgi:uncharacterized repeat protein (TIGR03803 family)
MTKMLSPLAQSYNRSKNSTGTTGRPCQTEETTRFEKRLDMTQLSGGIYMKKLQTLFSVLALVTFFATGAANAQTYTLLYTFPTTSSNSSGVVPPGLMSQGRDGELYSTISSGGAHTYGTAFKMTTAGSLTTIYDFCALASCADGSVPHGGLTLGTDGNLYGTTGVGGLSTFGGGTVFKITPTGTLTTLWKFSDAPATDGGNSMYAPFQGQDGNFYGVNPGVYSGDYGRVFKITSAGKLTVPGLFNFTDGNSPNLPIQGTDGNFYGTTVFGGTTCANGCGVVYKMTPGGKLSVLHNFTGYSTTNPSDGTFPYGALVQGNDGYFYGVTYNGGTFNQGTVFKISATGKSYIILHSFENDFTVAAGANPFAGLAMGSDGNFYGTSKGGKNGGGALYKVTPAGGFSILYNFCSLKSCADGFNPNTVITQHTNGKFYGNTVGNSLGGSVFYSLDTGLAPFVSSVTSVGKGGATVEILGQGFTGASGVSFNGTPATFTVVADSYLTAIIPAAAGTGLITVATPGGTRTSNRVFRVTPVVLSFSPASGLVGATVVITGKGFTGATKVTFGGVNAPGFMVNSGTQITATVPTAAKTGKIQVTTPGGAVSSPASFTVLP